MSSRRLAKISLAGAIVMMVVAVGGFIVALVLNAFFLDRYNAYGEVPIPGSGSLHLPAGEVTVSLHTVVIGRPNGGLPVPPLGVTIAPPDGVAQPVVTESIGGTTTVNNDAHVRVWVARIAADGTYNVTTDGKVNGYIDPRLAFGHRSSYGFLVWVFVTVFVVGLVDSIMSGMWLARTRRRAVSSVVSRPVAAQPPGDQDIR
ncbi:SHOCT domain-containing protein [Mycobacterium malmoense]|uniref:SHOCT domain-containing protein n=1 Tax=Mycobacterium malmoense TaxID=1780 RepID=UPI000ADF11F7|nr:SHOCT domain-containing protein [Mycobacterium malmoense]